MPFLAALLRGHCLSLAFPLPFRLFSEAVPLPFRLFSEAVPLPCGPPQAAQMAAAVETAAESRVRQAPFVVRCPFRRPFGVRSPSFTLSFSLSFHRPLTASHFPPSPHPSARLSSPRFDFRRPCHGPCHGPCSGPKSRRSVGSWSRSTPRTAWRSTSTCCSPSGRRAPASYSCTARRPPSAAQAPTAALQVAGEHWPQPNRRPALPPACVSSL